MDIARIGRMIGKGIGDIGKSMNSPSDPRRPRISQMPASKREMRIAHSSFNLDYLKTPSMRGRKISGR